MNQTYAQAQEGRLVSIATQMLASQLGIDPRNIKVEVVQYVKDWGDENLGLPPKNPNEFTDDTVEPGYRIILEYGNTPYEYHTDLGIHVVRYK